MCAGFFRLSSLVGCGNGEIVAVGRINGHRGLHRLAGEAFAGGDYLAVGADGVGEVFLCGEGGATFG